VWRLKEVETLLRRRILLAALVAVIAAGCAGVQRVEEEIPPGPFEIALLATTDTRGELEPCG
jgi:hypothetical protein